MTTTDYITDIALILIIFRQVRARELTARSALLPLVIVAWAGQHYLHGFPTAGNDLSLIALFAAIGAGLGVWSGAATRIWRRADGAVLSRVGVAGVFTWIAGMGFRFAFALWASTASGADALAHFSRHHDITTGQAWTTALVLMAFAEVLARLAIVQWRRVHLDALPQGDLAAV
ncbi:MAG: hypothetical protein ACTHMS_24375 [Jatrophihabitans sp.]|uniref:hypothetical protein n=1 Tax=Jatrophihabitans sp. TaxID=1932789 RepID=UPI003F7FE080